MSYLSDLKVTLPYEDLAKEYIRLWERQKAYNNRVKGVQDRTNGEWMETYILGMVSELGDLLEEMTWKKHRVDYRSDFGPNVGEELADLTKYLLSMWELMGYGPWEIISACHDKSEILEFKFNQEHREPEVEEKILLVDLDGVVADFRGGFLSLNLNSPSKPGTKKHLSPPRGISSCEFTIVSLT